MALLRNLLDFLLAPAENSSVERAADNSLVSNFEKFWLSNKILPDLVAIDDLPAEVERAISAAVSHGSRFKFLADRMMASAYSSSPIWTKNRDAARRTNLFWAQVRVLFSPSAEPCLSAPALLEVCQGPIQENASRSFTESNFRKRPTSGFGSRGLGDCCAKEFTICGAPERIRLAMSFEIFGALGSWQSTAQHRLLRSLCQMRMPQTRDRLQTTVMGGCRNLR